MYRDSGSLMHYLLEVYYTLKYNGAGWQSSMNQALERVVEMERGNNHKGKVGNLTNEEILFVKTRFTQYVANYHQSDYKPLARKGKPAIEVGFSVPIVDNSYFLFVLEGRLDFIADYNDLVYNVDNKCQWRKENKYWGEVQFLNYSLATGVNRMLVNIIGMQKAFKPEYLRRQLFYYSPLQLRIWRSKLERIFYTMAHAITCGSYDKRESSCCNNHRVCEFSEICREYVEPGLVQLKRGELYEPRPLWQPWNENEA